MLSDCSTNLVDGAVAGQAVFGQVAGSLASHVVADTALVVPMPPTVTFQQACTMPTVFMTADIAFQHAMHVAPGTQALLHAAAGVSPYPAVLVSCSTSSNLRLSPLHPLTGVLHVGLV